MSNENPFSLIESRALREREDNLLVHACHSKLSVFPLFLSQCSLLCYDFFPKDYYYPPSPPSVVHGKGLLYSVYHDRILLF